MTTKYNLWTDILEASGYTMNGEQRKWTMFRLPVVERHETARWLKL